MISSVRIQQVAESLRRLAAAHATMVKEVEETLATVSSQLGFEERIQIRFVETSALRGGYVSDEQPIANAALLAVVYHGKHCFLGDTLMFRFFRRLCEQPNEYVSYDDLIHDVWQAKRSRQAVRNVALQLRRKLIRAHMQDVAAAIDGRSRGHYALMLRKRK